MRRPSIANLDQDRITLASSGLLGRVDPARFLGIAESLARLLADIHERGLVHQDISPDSILIRPTDDRLQLADFTPAPLADADAPGPVHPSGPSANPTYCAPEQTGRLHRPVDHRTDLYALGLVLYALATGSPPFTETDPLALIHAHLARDPQPPRQRAPWMPEVLECLILTLLAKEPDERYQSATGLLHDLRHLRLAVAAGEPLAHVHLHHQDLPLSPCPPRRLHGRASESAQLMASFMDVCKGEFRTILVGGHAGVGKTALIQQILRPVSLNQGRFVSGKCEQFQRDRPLLAPARALAQACRMLLSDPVERLESRRRQILAGLGRDASALFELLPDLERLLGAQPDVPSLGPIEIEQRLRTLLLALLRQIAGPEHPLVLFLDDLQWADRPTLDLIEAVLEAPPIPGLLLIGAYRDHEIDARHPLEPRLQRWQLAPRTQTLSLSNLPPETLTHLLADMLRTPVDAIQPLAARIHDRSGGNPLFALELVNALHRAGVLRLNPARGGWIWNDGEPPPQAVGLNLVEFLVSGLAELPDQTTEILFVAACLGSGFSVGRLALVTAQSPNALLESLAPALARGVLIAATPPDPGTADSKVELRFAHDRLQQAAYRLRDAAEQAHRHRRIATCLDADGSPEARFSAAEHYALATHLLDTAAERTRVRELFTEAAHQARRSGAPETAERFLRLALEQLGSELGPLDPERLLDLQTELHLALYAQARHAEADAVYAELAAHTDDPMRLVDPTCTQIANLSSRLRYREAIELGQGFLERLGVPLPMHDLDRTLQHLLLDYSDVFDDQGLLNQGPDATVPPQSALGRELAAVQQWLAGGGLERLAARGEMAEARSAGAVRLMNALIPAASITHPALLAWLPLRVGRLWIEAGYCPEAIYPMVSVGPVIMAFHGDFATAERLVRTVLEIGETREDGRETARAWFVHVNYAGHWRHRVELDVTHAERACGALERVGDLEFAAFSRLAGQAARLDTAERLADLEHSVTDGLDFARRAGNRHGEQGHLVYRQLIRALQGHTAEPGGFDDADFDARLFERDVQGVATRAKPSGATGLRAFVLRHVPLRYLLRLATWGRSGNPWGNPAALCYFHLYRALAACLLDDEAAHARHIETALDLTHFVYGTYPTAHVNLLHSLSLTQRLSRAPAAERARRLERLTLNQRWLGKRADEAPMNFAHLHALIEAERQAALDEPWAALQSMERAMRLAQAHRRPWHLAFITERAGRLYMRLGLEFSGRPLLTRAYQLYRDWGASAKTQAMRRLWPFVALPRPANGTVLDDLEQTALARASEALAHETSRSGLVTRIMHLTAYLTGATDVFFLALNEAGDWSLEGGLHGVEPLGGLPLREAESQGLVATSVLRLGMTTREAVVSDDAVLDSRFAAEPCYQGLTLCAVLGLPLVVQGRVDAFLILENQRLRAAFSTAQAVDPLGGVGGEPSPDQNLRLASFSGLVALHSVLDARNQALREANHQALDQARQALAVVERERALRDQQAHFIDLVTHEYRTPLAILQTNLDLLMFSREPAHWHKGLANMQSAIERLGEVFDGSLRRGDWDSRQSRCFTDLDLSDWLARLIEETVSGWTTPAPEIRFAHPGTVVIRTDPALLKTALLNLLENARKYGPPAGPIAVDLERDGAEVVIAVANDCVSAPARSPQELLAKSVRGANSPDIPGLGLGLYLVDRLVRDLGGRVEIRLDPPGRFEIRLTFSTTPHGGSSCM